MTTNKFELVELTLVAGTSGQRFNFPDQPKLRFSNLNAVEAYNADDLTTSPSGVTPISATNFKNAYLVLYSNGQESLNRIPLISLHRTQTGTTNPFVRSLMQFQGQQIAWEKSYVLTGSAITIGGSSNSFLFGVYYSCK